MTWGFLTNNILSAVFLSLVLETLNYSKTKWALSRRDFYRVTDFTSILFVVISIIQFSRYSLFAIYQIIAVAPYCFFPLILAQLASSAGRIPISSFYYSRRKRKEKGRPVDIRPLYLMGCVIAASTSQDAPLLFFLSATLIVISLLFTRRNQRYGFRIWLMSLV